MSPEAEKLKELLGKAKNADLSGTLSAHPELMAGLNEYLSWRDTMLVNEAKKEEKSNFGHSAKKAAEAIKKKKK